MSPSLVRGAAPLALALFLSALAATVHARGDTGRIDNNRRVSAQGQAEDGSRLLLSDELLAEGGMERVYTRGSQVLYRSRIQLSDAGLVARVSEGHPSQLGTIRLTGSQLAVSDAQGQLLWSETLSRPLCLPEFSPEFVQAHWERLAPGSAPLACGVPIIKARKVALVQWVRLPDGPGGERIVELQPGSFGMRFFLRPTRLTFSADGRALLAQSGQFESVRDPQASASYLKGQVRFDTPREAQRWPVQRFGPPAASS